MSRTHHHERPWREKRAFQTQMGLPHAPGWFRHLLNRLYRRKADRELRQRGEVVTKKPKGADWEWW